MRIYICSDLQKLIDTLEHKSFDNIVSKYFPKSLFNSNKPFHVKQTWELKKNDQANDYIIGLGSTESSFVRLTSSVAINSYQHIDYPGLLVLQEYFCQTEVLLIISFYKKKKTKIFNYF